MLARRYLLWITALGATSLACGSRTVAGPVSSSPKASSEALKFSLPGLDGQLVESQQLRGRVTVLLFLTTFDVACQEQARRLEDLYRTHAPRLNALGVVVEAPHYSTLASEYRDSLGLSYPLVMGERAVLDAHEDLRKINAVPAWIVLDREGRPVSSASGAISFSQLEEMVQEAETK